MKTLLPILLFALLIPTESWAQKKKDKKKKQSTQQTATNSGTPNPNAKKKKFSDYVTKDAISKKGVFNTHLVKSDLFLEIPLKQLGKEFLVVTRISKTPGIGYGGENLNNQVIRWELMGDKLLMRSVSYQNIATDSTPIYTAVRNSNFEPILAALEIKAYNADSSAVLVDVSPVFLQDTYPFTIQASARKDLEIKGLDKSRTYFQSANAFPINVEIRAVLTFNAGKPAQQSSIQAVSVELNHSILALPEKPMTPRYGDVRMGYFGLRKSEFGETHQADDRVFIVRWRLEPKPEDVADYLAGKLVEPAQPIIYYIDPATPLKWRNALKRGVEDWNVAFEAAGWKNAIRAMDAPENDPDWSPEDARYSVIRYFASPIMNAYGPNVNDPRTGQILESDIGWYHNVMKLLRNWYFVQAGAVDPLAAKLPLPDSLMEELIRFVAAHEVGHTIGLMHNMKASHHYPVDSLRSKTFTQKYGTAPSIMDYARFNYVAQPGDGAALFPKVGPYDKFAIKWGYTWFPNINKPEDELPTLNQWLLLQEKDSTLRYGVQQFRVLDPYAQTEDLGDDAVKATTYGVKNLDRIMKNLLNAVEKEGDNYNLLKEMYLEVWGQWAREMGHVANYVGGIDRIEKTFGMAGNNYSMIPNQKQIEAIRYIGSAGFNPPASFFNEEITSKIGGSGITTVQAGYMNRLVNTMLDDEKLLRLIEYQEKGGLNIGTAMLEIQNTVWSNLSKTKLTYFERSLQRTYIDNMEKKAALTNELRGLARLELRNLETKIKAAYLRTTDYATKMHFADMQAQIEKILKAD